MLVYGTNTKMGLGVAPVGVIWLGQFFKHGVKYGHQCFQHHPVIFLDLKVQWKGRVYMNINHMTCITHQSWKHNVLTSVSAVDSLRSQPRAVRRWDSKGWGRPYVGNPPDLDNHVPRTIWVVWLVLTDWDAPSSSSAEVSRSARNHASVIWFCLYFYLYA